MILAVLQIIVAVILIAVILLQAQGGGLSTAFGGSEGVYRSRRSFEKFLVGTTIFLAALFGILSVFLLLPR